MTTQATSHKLFVVYDTPIQTMWSLDNKLTCQRIDALTTKANGKKEIDDIAPLVQEWQNEKALAGPITAKGSGSSYWSMADKTTTGQCAQGAILQSLANRLLGIDADYQHVFAAKVTSQKVVGQRAGERARFDEANGLWQRDVFRSLRGRFGG